MREQHALTVARVNGRNSTISDALLRRPKYTAGGWVWVYNTAATIRQGSRKGTDNIVLKEKLSLNWTGPFKILAVGPTSGTTTPTDAPSAINCYTLTYQQTCLVPPPSLASLLHAASLAPTLTMLTTCLDIYQLDLPNMSYMPLRSSRPLTTSLTTMSPHRQY